MKFEILRNLVFFYYYYQPASFGGDGVDLVEKDDGRCGISSFAENLPYQTLRLANPLAKNLGSLHGYEIQTRLGSQRFGFKPKLTKSK